MHAVGQQQQQQQFANAIQPSSNMMYGSVGSYSNSSRAN